MSDSQTTAFDLDLLETTYGPTARREFEGARESEQPGLWTWAFETLPGMFDSVFVTVASRAIYDSANMGRFRGNFEDVHFKATACYRESERRQRLAHPDEDCRATSLYERAYNITVRDAGHSHMAAEVRPCTCSTDTQADSDN